MEQVGYLNPHSNLSFNLTMSSFQSRSLSARLSIHSNFLMVAQLSSKCMAVFGNISRGVSAKIGLSKRKGTKTSRRLPETLK